MSKGIIEVKTGENSLIRDCLYVILRLNNITATVNYKSAANALKLFFYINLLKNELIRTVLLLN